MNFRVQRSSMGWGFLHCLGAAQRVVPFLKIYRKHFYWPGYSGIPDHWRCSECCVRVEKVCVHFCPSVQASGYIVAPLTALAPSSDPALELSPSSHVLHACQVLFALGCFTLKIHRAFQHLVFSLFSFFFVSQGNFKRWNALGTFNLNQHGVKFGRVSRLAWGLSNRLSDGREGKRENDK